MFAALNRHKARLEKHQITEDRQGLIALTRATEQYSRNKNGTSRKLTSSSRAGRQSRTRRRSTFLRGVLSSEQGNPKGNKGASVSAKWLMNQNSRIAPKFSASGQDLTSPASEDSSGANQPGGENDRLRVPREFLEVLFNRWIKMGVVKLIGMNFLME